MTGDVTRPTSDPVTHHAPPAGLGPRGLVLWQEWSALRFGRGHLVLLEEACRAADTLERLHGLLGGDSENWLELADNAAESDGDTRRLVIVVNPLMVEIRQQQGNYRQLISELRLWLTGRASVPQHKPSIAEPETSAEDAPVGGGEEGLGDLINAAGRFTAPR